MNNTDIVNKVVEIYFRDGCSVETAFKRAYKELGIKGERAITLLKAKM